MKGADIIRMKDVCEKTGLTDRAVRLYIESGLLNPKRVNSYTGRSSIYFTDSDVKILEAVATLRKADFSITDIKAVIDDPEKTASIVEGHKTKLFADIESKKNILNSLSISKNFTNKDIFGLANIIRGSALENNIPKEDSLMNLKDLKKIMRTRSTSLLSLIFAIAGIIYLFPLIVKTVFAKLSVSHGGGYEISYVFNTSNLLKGILPIASLLLLITAAVLCIAYLSEGSKKLLTVSATAYAATILLLLLLPADSAQLLKQFEFISYRFSPLFYIFYYPGNAFTLFISSIKFLFPAISLIFSFIGILKEKNLE